MRIGIAGLGLIGGSFALALRSAHELRGYDVDAAEREAAARAGIAVVQRLEALLPADAVIVATPLRAVLETLATLAPIAGDAVIADVTSVREPIEAFARERAGHARIVGLHPMAGGTGSGFGAADAATFSGVSMLLVPTAASDTAALDVARSLAIDTGARVIVCAAERHDRLVALTSALPLAAAVALAAVADELGDDLADFAGPGLRDTTRLADSRPELAEALLLANAGNVIGALARMRGALDGLEEAVAARDPARLRDLLERSAAVRARLAQASAASIS